MRKLFAALAVLAGVCPAAFGQYSLYQNCHLQTATGQAVAGAQVYFLAQPANTVTLTPLAQVYSSSTGGAVTQPVTTNGFGECSAYLSPGTYTVVYISAYTGQLTYPDQLVGGGNGGANFPSTPGVVWNTNSSNAQNATSAQIANVLNASPSVQLSNALIPQNLTPTTINGVLQADQFPGSDACAKVNAAIQSLPASGGVVNATGFGATTQVVSATCGSVLASGELVTLRFSPATTFEPASPTTTIFNVMEGTQLVGAHVNTTNVAYTGNAISLTDNYSDGYDTSISHVVLNGGAAGNAIYISPGAAGAAFVHVADVKTMGFANGLDLVATASGFINSNFFDSIEIKNAVTCINMDGTAQTLSPNTTAVSGNQFVNVSCESGAQSNVGLKLQNASRNLFTNVDVWDFANSASFDANSGFNFWSGIGAWAVTAQPGPANNYYDAQSDSVSSSGMHNIYYTGGINFDVPKVGFTSGALQFQMNPTSTGLNFVTLGCCADTFISGNQVKTDTLVANAGGIQSAGPVVVTGGTSGITTPSVNFTAAGNAGPVLEPNPGSPGAGTFYLPYLPSGGTGALAMTTHSVIADAASITLNGNASLNTVVLTMNTSFTLPAVGGGQSTTICWQQGSSSYTVTPPANLHGFTAVGSTANTFTCQTFMYNDTAALWLAVAAGVTSE